MIGLYAAYFFIVYHMFRTIFHNLLNTVMFDEMPYVDRVLRVSTIATIIYSERFVMFNPLDPVVLKLMYFLIEY